MKRLVGYTLDDLDRAILRGVAEGKSNPAIASEVHLAPDTVKKRLGAIGEFLGNGHRAAIAAEAVRRGFVR